MKKIIIIVISALMLVAAIAGSALLCVKTISMNKARHTVMVQNGNKHSQIAVSESESVVLKTQDTDGTMIGLKAKFEDGKIVLIPQMEKKPYSMEDILNHVSGCIVPVSVEYEDYSTITISGIVIEANGGKVVAVKQSHLLAARSVMVGEKKVEMIGGQNLANGIVLLEVDAEMQALKTGMVNPEGTVYAVTDSRMITSAMAEESDAGLTADVDCSAAGAVAFVNGNGELVGMMLDVNSQPALTMPEWTDNRIVAGEGLTVWKYVMEAEETPASFEIADEDSLPALNMVPTEIYVQDSEVSGKLTAVAADSQDFQAALKDAIVCVFDFGTAELAERMTVRLQSLYQVPIWQDGQQVYICMFRERDMMNGTDGLSSYLVKDEKQEEQTEETQSPEATEAVAETVAD